MSRKSDWLDGVGRTIDRVVMAFAPEQGAKRIAMRQMGTVLSSQGRDRDDEDRLYGNRWSGLRYSADTELELSLVDRRTKSRELYKDDSIGGAIEQDLDHVIGKGWRLQSKADPISVDEEQIQKFRAEVEMILQVWSMQADRTGRQSLWSLTQLMWRTYRVDGECFAVLSDKYRYGVPIPLCIEIIDGERVDTPPDRIGDKNVRMGVEYNNEGDVVAYHIRRSHPFDAFASEEKFDRIPAERVIHIYAQWFPHQSRGFPWFTRVLKRLRDATDLDTAGIIAAQVQTCFAAFTFSDSDNPFAAARAASSGTTSGGQMLQDIRPGAIHNLGKSSKPPVFAQPTGQNTVGPLQELNHRRIATGMNYAYEFLMRDFRGLSFAGGRLVLNGSKRSVEANQQRVRETWYQPIIARVVEEAIMVGAVSLQPRLYARQPWAWALHKATPPAWGYAINPKEEVDADIAELDGCLTTLEDLIAKRGGDYEEVIAQRRKEIAQLKEAGIERPAQQAPASQRPASAPADDSDSEDLPE